MWAVISENVRFWFWVEQNIIILFHNTWSLKLFQRPLLGELTQELLSWLQARSYCQTAMGYEINSCRACSVTVKWDVMQFYLGQLCSAPNIH